MNSKLKILTLILFLPLSFIYSWGEKGHTLINEKAVAILPAEMKSFTAWKDYLGMHASDADFRKKNDKDEFPRHFIDIDFYREFLTGSMIENKDELTAKYGDSIVTANGILPWATMQTLKDLTNAFKEKNRDKILIYAADLGHYVADGHQPMHTVVNYDGQFTNQKGVHFRYEVSMIDRYIDTLQQVTDSSNVRYVNNPLDFVFRYISNANSINVVLLNGDKIAQELTGSNEGDNYLDIFWFHTRYVTKLQFKTAEQDLASLLYTAWVNGGKPLFSNID